MSIPHLIPTFSAPEGGEGERRSGWPVGAAIDLMNLTLNGIINYFQRQR